MNLKFSHKVFLAFLLNSLIIVVCMLLIGRYYSERHFEEYVAKVEAARATKLVDALSQEYRKRGNWDSVLKEPGLWFGLERSDLSCNMELESAARSFTLVVHRWMEKRNRLHRVPFTPPPGPSVLGFPYDHAPALQTGGVGVEIQDMVRVSKPVMRWLFRLPRIPLRNIRLIRPSPCSMRGNAP